MKSRSEFINKFRARTTKCFLLKDDEKLFLRKSRKIEEIRKKSIFFQTRCNFWACCRVVRSREKNFPEAFETNRA
jgi:hypothetical protein